MADNNSIPAYPNMFDPSQFSNKYSLYAGKALPWPSSYQGPATDAYGNVIPSYAAAQAAHDAWQPPAAAAPSVPGTTLNSQPAPIHGVAGLQPGQYDAASGLPTGQPMQFNHATDPSGMPWGQTSLGRGVVVGGGAPQQIAPQAPQAPQAAAPTNPIDMGQAYLNALSNPGHMNTPGATVPQAPLPSGQSGVLQQFLANWKPGANPAGNYNPSLFTGALQGQV